jgi:hypothetical protein
MCCHVEQRFGRNGIPQCGIAGKDDAEMSENGFARQREVWDCLKRFDLTPQTETEFRARMKELPDEDLTLLRAFYRVADDCDLLAIICRFWNVRISRPKAG